MIHAYAPSLEDIDTIARKALAKLPEPFAGYLKDVVLVVEDLPSDDLLRELEIDNPYELTGLYMGRPAEQEAATGDLPPMVHLFRRPILEEWIDTGVNFEQLVSLILIHEVGHHFGLSDEDMAWLEDTLKPETK
ncbi:MAG: metallopeptidase family protein [Asticcacaulis sp.]